MKSISIKNTKLTPSVILNAKNGLLEIEGSSITDNATEFYQPVLEFINEYVLKPAATTIVNIKLSYITIHSLKCILEILKKLEPVHKKGKSNIVVNWHYDDSEMLEIGKNYKSILKLPFNLMEV